MIASSLYFEKKELFMNDFDLEHMKRNCLINIDKNSLINFINAISNLTIESKDQIFLKNSMTLKLYF